MLRSALFACVGSLALCSGTTFAQCGPASAPATPGQVFAEDATSCTCTFVHWEPIASASQVTYRVWRAIDNDYDTIEMVADRYPTGTFADFSAPPGIECTYWVQAINADGCVSELSASDNGQRRPDAPIVTSQPNDVNIAPGITVAFEVEAQFASSVQWRRDQEPLTDGDLVIGSTSNILTIVNATTLDVGNYDAVIRNDCGEIETIPAKLVVGDEAPCAQCSADFDTDGGVDQGDLEAFFTAWSDGARCGDVNRDGGIDGADIGVFFDLWAMGGC